MMILGCVPLLIGVVGIWLGDACSRDDELTVMWQWVCLLAAVLVYWICAATGAGFIFEWFPAI